MSVSARLETLESLFAYLDGLDGRPALDELQERLEALDVSPEDLSEYIQFSDQTYLRNLVRAGPHYHALAICWRSGQRSPIHNHASSVCGVKVVTGVATETIFEPTPCGQLKAVGSFDRRAGEACASQDSDTHQVSNLQPDGTDLVTLHIYSPPLLAMDTFSITGERETIYRPVVLEHRDGSGI